MERRQNTFRLDEDLMEEFREISSDIGMPMNGIIERKVREWVSEQRGRNRVALNERVQEPRDQVERPRATPPLPEELQNLLVRFKHPNGPRPLEDQHAMAALESLPHAATVHDEADRLVFANEGFLRMVSMTRAQVLGLAPDELGWPEGAAAWTASQNAAARGSDAVTIALERPPSSGAPEDVIVRRRAWRDTAGRVRVTACWEPRVVTEKIVKQVQRLLERSSPDFPRETLELDVDGSLRRMEPVANASGSDLPLSQDDRDLLKRLNISTSDRA